MASKANQARSSDVSEWTEDYIIHAPDLDAMKRRLEATGIRAVIDMEEIEGATGFRVHLTRRAYEALPAERRWAPVLADTTLETLGALFPRVCWLSVHDNKYSWRIDCSLGGK